MIDPTKGLDGEVFFLDPVHYSYIAPRQPSTTRVILKRRDDAASRRGRCAAFLSDRMFGRLCVHTYLAYPAARSCTRLRPRHLYRKLAHSALHVSPCLYAVSAPPLTPRQLMRQLMYNDATFRPRHRPCCRPCSPPNHASQWSYGWNSPSVTSPTMARR